MAGAIQPYRPSTPDDRIRTVDTLVDVVAPLFEDTYDRAANYPEFIRSNEARSPIFDAARSVARLNCRLWASSDKSNYSVTVNAKNSELCGPYLEQIGEKPTEGELAREFDGGQCATRYNVRFNLEVFPFSDCSTFGEGPAELNGVLGPIRGLAFRTENPSGPLCTPGGNNVYLLHGGTPGETIIGGAGYGVKCSITSVTRADGQPDNCGNPVPIIRPPATVTPVTPIPPSITINLPGVGPINIEIELDPKGNPIIIAPELEIEVPIDVEGGGDDGGDGGGGAPPFDPEVGEPIDVPPGGGGGGGEDTPFGDPPPGRIWVGAFVRLLGDLSPFGVIPGTGNGQAAIATVLGNASLTILNDVLGERLRGTFTQIRSEWSDHLVPVVGLTVTGIRVNVNPALGYRVYPVSVKDPLAESTENG